MSADCNVLGIKAKRSKPLTIIATILIVITSVTAYASVMMYLDYSQPNDITLYPITVPAYGSKSDTFTVDSDSARFLGNRNNYIMHLTLQFSTNTTKLVEVYAVGDPLNVVASINVTTVFDGIISTYSGFTFFRVDIYNNNPTECILTYSRVRIYYPFDTALIIVLGILTITTVLVAYAGFMPNIRFKRAYTTPKYTIKLNR